MKARIVFLIFMLALAYEALACPVCTAERQLREGWHFKYFLLNVGMAIVFTANRLDIQRVFYTMGACAILSFKIHDYLLFHTFPYPSDTWLRTLTCSLAWWTWGLHVVGIGILFLASRFRFFRRNKEAGLKTWQPIAYGAAVFLGLFLIG